MHAQFKCTATSAIVLYRVRARVQMCVIMCGSDGFMSIRCSNRISMCAFVCCGQFTSVTCVFNITRTQISYIQLDFVGYFIDYSQSSLVVYLFHPFIVFEINWAQQSAMFASKAWRSDYKLINTNSLPPK